MGRWLRAALLVGLLLALAFVTVRPFRIAVLTLAVTPELLDTGPRVLSALVPAPQRITVEYGPASSPDLMDLYLPRDGAAQRPAMLLVLGVHPVPRDHPAVVRVAEALTRLGIVVAVPESAAMKAGAIRPAEPDGLVAAFEVVAARREVDARRIGFAGFSVGGSVALIAAADPRIADRLAYVNAFGAYADASAYLVEIVTRSMVVDGRPIPWMPGELTRTTYLELVLGFLPDRPMRERLRDRLAPAFLRPDPPRALYDETFAATLDRDALALYRLSTAASAPEARAALDELSPGARATLAQLSPVTFAADLRAPIFLMHDEADDAIPFAQLDRLAKAIPARLLQRVTAFRLFEHVQPRRGLDPGALPEIWKLFWHLQAALDRAL